VLDADVAIAAARAGADVVRARYGSALTRVAKVGIDFATEADLESERAITAVLRAQRPADQFVGEESGRSGDRASTRTWLVDPLCGTLNYAAQTPLVAVNVALRDPAGLGAAAVVDPIAGELFWTDGDRSYRGSGVGESVVPSGDSALVDLNLDGPYPNGAHFRTAELSLDAEFNSRFQSRVIASTLALAWVAAGRRAAYVSDGELGQSVPFAAGIALCQAAGCLVTGLRGQRLHSGVEGLVVAADASTHDLLLGAIERQFDRSAT
jgi:myo-inositol-1(or 4)-monophosphatase